MEIRVVDTDVWSYLYKARAEAKLYEPHLLDNILVNDMITADAYCALNPLGLYNPPLEYNRTSN